METQEEQETKSQRLGGTEQKSRKYTTVDRDEICGVLVRGFKTEGEIGIVPVK